MRNLVILVLVALLVGCGCGSKQDAIASAKSLPQQRLTQLFTDLSTLKSPRAEQNILLREQSGEIPPNFKDLKPRYIKSDGFVGTVNLAGCGDDMVNLVIWGLDGSMKKRIVLQPGEAEDEIELWHSN